VRVEETKDPLVVDKGISVIRPSPPGRIGGNGEHCLAVVETHLEDRSVLNRSIGSADVLRIGLDSLVPATSIGALCRELGRRDRCLDLPSSKVTKAGVEREHVVQSRRRGAGKTEDDERPLHRIARLRPVGGVPALNAETSAEAGDEKGLDPIDGSAVLTGVPLERLDQVVQAGLPVTRPEIGQTGLGAGPLEQLADDDAHGAPFCLVRVGSSSVPFGRKAGWTDSAVKTEDLL